MRLPAVLRQKYSLGGEKCQKKIKTKCAYLVRGNRAPIAHEALAGAGRYRGDRYHTHLLQLEPSNSFDISVIIQKDGYGTCTPDQ